MAAQTRKLKKNIPGFYEGGLFHPIRTPQYVQTSKGKRAATKADKAKYDRDRAGDNDDVFDKEIRKSRNLKKADENWKSQEENRIRREMFGDNDRAGEGKTLVQFVRSSGGIKRTYDKRTGKSYDAGELDGLTFKQSKKRGLVSDDKGKSLDKMFQAAREAGYDLSDENDLIDRMDDEIRSGKATFQSHGFLDYRDNPARMKKNVEGFKVGGTFHPIRKSADYDGLLAGDFDKTLAQTGKLLQKRRFARSAMKQNGSRFDVRYSVVKEPDTMRQKGLYSVKRSSGDGKKTGYIVRGVSKKTADDAAHYFNEEMLKLKKQLSKIKTNSSSKGKSAVARTTKAKKRTPAKKGANLRKNGILSTFANAAVGTSAALNVLDRLNPKKKISTPAAKTMLHRNKAKAAANQQSLFETRAAQDDLYEKALVAIENGDLSKQADAKRHGKLAGINENEVQKAIQYARLTFKLKSNPTPATIRETENVLLKTNGLFGRALARHKAGKLYKKQLRLESALSRAKSKRAKQEAKAKKNPTKKVTRTVTKAKKRTTAKKPLKTRKNPSAYESFQGRPSTKTVEVTTPTGAPKTVYCLGTLFELRLKGADDLNFRRELTGKTFYLCADLKNNQLWIAGGRIATPDDSVKNGFAQPLAEITHVIYETKKVHLGDTGNQGYIHKFGEEGGKRPTLAIDGEGFAIITGGDYTITPLGIAD